MGQGPARGGHRSSDEYESRQRPVDLEEAQQQVDEAIERAADRFEKSDRVDETDVGRVAGGAAGGFLGGVAAGLAGSAIGSAVGREAGGRTAGRYAAAQAPREPGSLTDIRGIGEAKAETLREAGYESVADIRQASREELEGIDGIGTSSVTHIQNATGAAADDDAGRVSATVRESIERTPFDYDFATPTEQARQEAVEATANVRELYRSTATTFAARTRNEEIAQTMADHIEEGQYERDQEPFFHMTAVGPNDDPTLSLPEDADRDDLNHELGHAVSDAYGYGRGEASTYAESKYRERFYRGENDPFIDNDPTNTEFHITQENGKYVDDVPEEFNTLMTETNRAWQRIQRTYQADGQTAAEEYTIRDNYSSTGASEVFSQLNEVMQSDDPDADEELVTKQADLVDAYFDCFEPSDTIKEWLDRRDERT